MLFENKCDNPICANYINQYITHEVIKKNKCKNTGKISEKIRLERKLRRKNKKKEWKKQQDLGKIFQNESKQPCLQDFTEQKENYALCYNFFRIDSGGLAPFYTS